MATFWHCPSLSHSDKDNCFKWAWGYWLLPCYRRANDRVVASLEMTLESATIRHPLSAMTLLPTSAIWLCACCSPANMRLHNSGPLRRSPDVAWCCADYHTGQPKKCFWRSGDDYDFVLQSHWWISTAATRTLQSDAAAAHTSSLTLWAHSVLCKRAAVWWHGLFSTFQCSRVLCFYFFNLCQHFSFRICLCELLFLLFSFYIFFLPAQLVFKLSLLHCFVLIFLIMVGKKQNCCTKKPKCFSLFPEYYWIKSTHFLIFPQQLANTYFVFKCVYSLCIVLNITCSSEGSGTRNPII